LRMTQWAADLKITNSERGFYFLLSFRARVDDEKRIMHFASDDGPAREPVLSGAEGNPALGNSTL
ncbi:MAG: hypothetical protein ACREQR_08420, partial [Candidatus Binataceae bacterium]